jgi:two-component system, OmpR family, sensor histidine kinase TctE
MAEDKHDHERMSFGLFQREQRSLFGEILDWMLTPLLLLWPLSLALTWFVAQGIATKPFDRALEFNLQALTQFVVSKDNGVSFNLTPQARDLLRADDSDLVYYQVLDPKQGVISGETDFPLPPDNDTPEPGRVMLRDDVVRGDEVRVAYAWLSRHPGAQRLVLMQVAETKGKRSTLATEIIKGVMVPQFIILPLAVLLVWMALVRGIRPLNDLEQKIRARKPDDLSPIEESYIPQEVAPLVSSINDLLTRLKASLTTQKRFLADAAHQLKTPLAGLRMQAELAQRESNPQDIRGSLQQIARASVRATHTVNQLLALARAETTGRTLPSARIDLARLVMGVVRDSVPRALEHGIDLGYEGPGRDPGELPDGRQPHPAAGNDPQPGGQRDQLLGPWRCGHGARAARPLQRRDHPAGGGQRTGHCPRTSANWCCSPSTGRSAPTSTARAWDWPSCTRSPSSTAPPCSWTTRTPRRVNRGLLASIRFAPTRRAAAE